MPYNHNMSKEKAPKQKMLLPAGWRTFVVKDGKETMSKQNNAMIAFDIKDVETKQEEQVYCLVVEGKRWLLKQLLLACGIKELKDGSMKWDIMDLIGKEVSGLVVHEPNKYINRDGVEVTTTQHKIINFQPTEWKE